MTMTANNSQRLYLDFYKFTETPFSLTPDPEFLFLSETHRAALEKLRYGLESRMGFMMLTGEVGTGKTTLCRALLDQIDDTAETVYIINPSLSGTELICSILDDLSIRHSPDASKKQLIESLNEFLLTTIPSRTVMIIIDDAQTIPVGALEDLRLLTNLETDKHKLLQIVLVGQPELAAHLSCVELRQLKQRIALSCHLQHLSQEEVNGYIDRRLLLAGNDGLVRFSSKAIRHIHRFSKGNPRLINKICDLALTAGYTGTAIKIESKHVKAALVELNGTTIDYRKSQKGLRLRRWAVCLPPAVFAGLGLFFFGFYHVYPDVFKRHLPPLLSTPPAITTLTEATAAAPKTVVGENPPANHPLPVSEGYILQLSSYKRLDTTLRAVNIYKERGFQVHWNAIYLGNRRPVYRVFLGRYPTVKAAKIDREKFRLNEARIMRAPWSVEVDPPDDGSDLHDVLKILVKNDFDGQSLPSGGGRLRIVSGAFANKERAEKMARMITMKTGFPTSVVQP